MSWKEKYPNQYKYYCKNYTQWKKWVDLYKKTEKGKYIKYRQMAKEKDLEFLLTFEEFKTFWQKPCYYCKDEIKTIGLDRIDNTKGYYLTNCVSCCSMCNYMKKGYKQKNFINQCKKIAGIL